jgi:hypothetical protein
MADENNPTLSETYTGGPLGGGEEISGGVEDIKGAATKLVQARELPAPEREIDIVTYRDEHGQPTNETRPLSLREASHDRAEMRDRVVAQREQNRGASADIDTIRNNRGELPGQQTTPQYQPQAPQPVQYFETGTREQWLAPQWSAQIQQHYTSNLEALARVEERIGIEAAAGHDLNDLYGYRNTLISYINHACYLGRVVLAINAGWSVQLAILLSANEAQEAFKNIAANYEQHYAKQIAFASGLAEDSYIRGQIAMVAMFPEMKGHIRNERDFDTALGVIRSRNPQRAESISQWRRYMHQSHANWQQLKLQTAHLQDQQARAWIQQEDARFTEKRPEMKSAAFALQQGTEALQYLESLGATKEEIRAAWHAPYSGMRSHIVQMMMHDAAKYWKAKSAIPSRRNNPVSRPMRPGSTMETPGRSAPKIDMHGTTQDQLRMGADLINARRAGRR